MSGEQKTLQGTATIAANGRVDRNVMQGLTKGRDMFDYETAANLCRGGSDKLRQFASQARWAHDDRESLSRVIADLRREMALRESEIAMLKEALLEHDGEA